MFQHILKFLMLYV